MVEGLDGQDHASVFSPEMDSPARLAALTELAYTRTQVKVCGLIMLHYILVYDTNCSRNEVCGRYRALRAFERFGDDRLI